MYNWLKIGAVIMAGRFLKPRLKGLLILIAVWLVINFLHGEYISYVELSGNADYLIPAALGKILLYIIAFVFYVLTVERRILQRTQQEIDAKHIQQSAPGKSDEDDGFDFLRQKKKLESPADQLLQKK